MLGVKKLLSTSKLERMDLALLGEVIGHPLPKPSGTGDF